MNIVLTRRLPGDLTPLAAAFDKITILEGDSPLESAQGRSDFLAADVAICTVSEKIGPQLLGEKLRCLITYSVGVDHIDLAAAKHRGIRLCHTPDALTEATADLTWALILASSREVVAGERLVRTGGFRGWRPEMLLGKAVFGSTLGILGMGRIGRAVAARAIGFSMPIIYFSRRRADASLEKSLSLEWVEWEVLLERADILSLHCPLTDATHHIVGETELSRMKPDALLVNTTRGPVIDEAALVAHLAKHPHFRAALDVFEREPELTPGLLECRNALCLPHLGSADRPTRERMTGICVSQAIAFANGAPLGYELKG
ncbi:MAG: D-glycerate dehydrogenase [Bdellovibrionales bacterium]|nr:D-glycerate dehydrogenase [Bdellovibrionales bacterium]